MWDTSCTNWSELIAAGKPPIPELPLFEAEAEKALRIFKRLRVPDIEGNPTYGEICDEWVFAIVRAVFGSYDPETKRRMIREFFVLIPKKNGKSSIAAAVIVVAIIMNRRPEAECLLIAPTKQIANIAFKHAAGIIRLDPSLSKLFHLQQHLRTITHRTSHAQIIIKAADTDAITGSKSTFILIDETHEFSRHARADEVFIEIRGGLAARPEGFILQITTQSKSRPTGVFKQELAAARDVRDGKVSRPVLAILYEFPKELQVSEEWKRPENWSLVNPNLGRSVFVDFLQDRFAQAERDGPEALALFSSQHFNVEIGVGLHTDRWEGTDYWLDRADPSLADLHNLIDRSDVVVVGIDGGGLKDLLGFAAIGRDAVSRRWLLWCRAWAHRKVLERQPQIAPALRDFEREGSLTIYDVAGEDVDELVSYVLEIQNSGKLPEKHGIGVDAVGISDIVDGLQQAGVMDGREDLVVAVKQGWQLANVIKSTARRLQAGTILHDGSSLMTWCVGNARVEPKGNAVMITKQAAGAGKIDPLMAAFNAVVLMATNPEAKGKSVYEQLAEMPAPTDAAPAEETRRYAQATSAYAEKFFAGED